MLKNVFKFLGSIYLALILLAVLIVVCVVATAIERDLTFQVVQVYVYSSWWFSLWLFLLGANVLCATALRYPWRGRKFGFLITHAGIILILLGGMIDKWWGIEGSLRLIEGEPGSNRIMVNEAELVVATDGQDESVRTPFSMAVVKRFPSSSFRAASPEPDIRINVLGGKSAEPRIGATEAPDGVPALKWRFIAKGMGERENWLFLNRDNLLGPAIIRFTRSEPPDSQGRSELSFYLDKSNQLRYRTSSKAGSGAGIVKVGKETPLNWGMGASFSVEEVLQRASLIWTPTDEKSIDFALRCQVEAGDDSQIVWVGPRAAPPFAPWQQVKVGGKWVRLFFEYKTQELPFKMTLVEFEAPQHEGTQRFTKFESVLRFNDKQGSEQKASMNNPATYPPTWWGPVLGTSYRISQSSHENRPDVSIVSVMRDPGWLPKWSGSLLLCVGIFMMFYLSGSRKTARHPGQDPKREDEKPDHSSETER